EPTPFGLHDLKLAVAAVKEIKMPFGIVINRTNAPNTQTHVFCQEENCTLLGEIPNDRRIAEAYAKGQTLVDALPEYRDLFSKITKKIMKNGKRK
ncbi:MAG TPA: (4Fe-4S)-binding protein, partial [Rhodospirillaceae bacterium]|nr:(4Fe-4S)-binding protein [Rhodospirillaceae bacterium]